MTIKQLYNKFQTPDNLQKHMLRVGALASLLTTNWKGKRINKKALVLACLLHDICKPVNFKPETQAKFNMPKIPVKKLESMQSFIKTNFGSDEHWATVKAARFFKAGSGCIKILKNLKWHFIPRLIKEKDLESLIAIYCDMRIGPKGVLTLSQRVKDLEKRRGGKDFSQLENYGLKLEQAVAGLTAVDPDSVTDKQLNLYFDKLLKVPVQG